MWQHYDQPQDLGEALDLLQRHAGRARLVAGGTDLLVALRRGVQPIEHLIDLSALPDLKYVRAEGGLIRLGALATHNDVVTSPVVVAGALPLAQACWAVGAPPIRARGTLAGNLVTASPANDTIPPLLALGAELVLASATGERSLPLADFIVGSRRTQLRADELIREIRWPALTANQRGLFLKLGLRRAQAIAVINLALVLTFDGAVVREARVALGSLAPTVVRAPSVERFVQGKELTATVCAAAGQLALADVAPIDDLRGSATYRRAALSNLLADGLGRLAAGRQAEDWPPRPIRLETPAPPLVGAPYAGVIATTINGRSAQLKRSGAGSLLTALRDEAGLTGTKEGCAEGECGACTVWLNGQAVMACLTPAPQAHRGTVVTIEGLAATAGSLLHPLQQAFIDHGAVQCGYCIPGMLMAGAKLLAEQPTPDHEQARMALSGNLCRCTGYRAILDAVLSVGGRP